MIEAVVFDLDGVLVESEEDWEQTRRDVLAELTGGVWSGEDQAAVLGANLRECSAIINARHRTGVGDEELGSRLVRRRMELYASRMPQLPGAAAAVKSISASCPVAIASSSPPEIIGYVVERLGLAGCFAAIASSDEVASGKPAPDVDLLACERLGV
ncbi:MAG: HAD family hydrolase, partial [Chloroflexota bacterium]